MYNLESSTRMSSKSIKNDTHGDGDDVESSEPVENFLVPVDLPPRERVFSIDHILEQIFGYLNTHDLFNCRLVSYRYLKIAQIPLQKRIHFGFYDYHLHKPINRIKTGKTLTKLTTFFKKSSALASKSASASTTKLISFPCSRFRFYGSKVQLGHKVLQDFLDTSGKHIRELQVIVRTSNIAENTLMNHLSHLLIEQAPSLENLDISVDPIVKWQVGVPTEIQIQIQGSVKVNQTASDRSHNSALYKTDPEFQQISARIESLPSKSSLKILKVNGEGWAKTLEFLFQVSPKLQEVIVDNDKYVHLVQPVKRAHMLRSLAFIPKLQVAGNNNSLDDPEDEDFDFPEDEDFNFDMELMEKISLDSNLRLRELKIDFQYALVDLKSSREFENKVVLMINKIFDDSKDTLQFLKLQSFTFLRGIRMPSSMPNVRKIEIMNSKKTCDASWTLFPRGFSLSEAFPNLASVKVTFFGGHFGSCDSLCDYLNCLDFGGDGDGRAVSLGVKEVILDSVCFKISRFTTIPTSISEPIKILFPNAGIRVGSWETFVVLRK